MRINHFDPALVPPVFESFRSADPVHRSFVPHRTRPVPHIYTGNEVHRIMAASKCIGPTEAYDLWFFQHYFTSPGYVLERHILLPRFDGRAYAAVPGRITIFHQFSQTAVSSNRCRDFQAADKRIHTANIRIKQVSWLRAFAPDFCVKVESTSCEPAYFQDWVAR
jgi:hypothetical protein